MERKSIVIDIPDGMCIDESKSTFEKIVFKKKENTKPRSWEEYCKNNEDKQVWFVKEDSDIGECHLMCRPIRNDKNTLPSKELAEAFLAMMQLMSLRQDWIHKWSIDSGMTDDWKPDWCGGRIIKWCIVYRGNDAHIFECGVASRPLSFPTEEMAIDFMNCFKDLLEVAKPLI